MTLSALLFSFCHIWLAPLISGAGVPVIVFIGAAGAIDNGPPGLRPHYHAHYYGAFVRDADGHNIETVCHEG